MRGALTAVSIICVLSWSGAAAHADNQKKTSDPKKMGEALKLAQSGDKAKASQMLHEVYQSTGDSHALFLHGNLAEDLGRYDEARAAYQLYLDKHSSGKHADDARKRLEGMGTNAGGDGMLSVESQPPGALVYRGDDLLGRTPIQINLGPGSFSLRVTKTGFKSVEKQVTVPGGKLINLFFELKADGGDADPSVLSDWGDSPPVNGSQLSVRTDVKGAMVLVDGILVGTTDGKRTPVTENVSSGVHAIAVHKFGRSSWGAHLRADHGETLQLDLELGREQSRGAKLAAWSIGGIGAASVLAGVGVGVGALLDEDQSRAESADVMILGGLTAIAAGVVVHWVTRSKPTEVKLRSAR